MLCHLGAPCRVFQEQYAAQDSRGVVHGAADLLAAALERAAADIAAAQEPDADKDGDDKNHDDAGDDADMDSESEGGKGTGQGKGRARQRKPPRAGGKAAKGRGKRGMKAAAAGGGEDDDSDEGTERDKGFVMLTALRQLCRGLAAEVPPLAHLPLGHATVATLVTHLQPRCAPAASWCPRVILLW